MRSLLVLCLLPVLAVFAKDFPPYVELCKQGPGVHDCILKNIDLVKPNLAGGIPEFFIPPLAPLVVKELAIEGAGFKMTGTDFKLDGLQNFELIEMDLDIDKNRLHAKLNFPFIDCSGKYVVKGQILVLTLDGSGMGRGNMSNLLANIDIDGYRQEKGGKQYIKFNRTEVSLKFNGPVFMYFDNLFGDREDMTKATNDVIQENVMDFVKEVQPFMEKTIVSVMMGIVKRLFDKFALDDLLPK